ncbi:hypothetical protein [Mesorhizobium sp. CO1-1-4]|uniref:hypothetical protein n=1 Tax=Mesorhizobium sp. CO1-1-4 TaxID=2876633 RepID=UPI001CCF0D28|nr:hypothetical protein [Mesorhizobium sp. CO1-1-4]MBZ9740611.1 hypothetical protein [Mesorhizobium sp. CO1-1-4]
MELRLHIEGAAPEEIARGVEAAQAVFDQEGIAADVAASGAFAVYIRDVKGFPGSGEPSESQRMAADVWLKAKSAACKACCAGWQEQPVVDRWALCMGPTEPTVKTVNPATWPERQRLYPEIITRLETATGPDRRLDLDICYVMGWINEPGTPQEAAELGLPYLTANLAEVADLTRKSLKDWTVEIDLDPCDARILDPERETYEDELDDRSVAAWRYFDGRTYMEKPPANTAIALTLAAMRLQGDSFLPQAW